MVCDVYDAHALSRAVVGFEPDIILDQLTDLPDNAADIPATTASNARIRREGTRNLLAAASTAGVTRFLAQSIAWHLDGDAGAAVEDMEAMVLGADGVILRYGQFYGPGTYHRQPPPPPRIHIDAAARRTVEALERDSGIISLLDPSA